jgi:outer membrane protein assembly factor BamB
VLPVAFEVGSPLYPDPAIGESEAIGSNPPGRGPCGEHGLSCTIRAVRGKLIDSFGFRMEDSILRRWIALPAGCPMHAKFKRESNFWRSMQFVAGLFSFLVLSGAPCLVAQDVLTWHNDNARTGQEPGETTLTLQNVTPRTFGKLFAIRVDGKVDAEPLYVGRIEIPHKGFRNVLFVATEHDSLYAFDADTGEQFWHVSLLKFSEAPSNFHCGQIQPEIGITATPVIDRHRGPHDTIYVVSMSTDPKGRFFHRLHALDLRTGKEEFGGPVDIQARFPGNGAGSQAGTEIFDPKQYAERAALLLLNGVIYTTWTSHCDIDPYTGWIISYNGKTLKQTGVLNITPNGEKGAIWQSGAGPAADPQGSIYIESANGTFDTVLDAKGFPSQGDFGNSFVKISATGARLFVADYFTMFDVQAENAVDMDLGSGGPLVLPDMTDESGEPRRLVVGVGKDRNIYIANRDAMGKFSPTGNQNIYQELIKPLRGTFYRGAPAYFDGRLYCSSVDDSILEFRFANSRLVETPVSQTATKFAYPGAIPSISADGSRNGIVWASESGDTAVLHAYDASDLAHELYNSNQAPSGRDHFGAGNKFITPMVAHGKVYVGTTDGVGVFGLLPNSRLIPK